MGLFLKAIEWVAAYFGINFTTMAAVSGFVAGGMIGAGVSYPIGHYVGYEKGFAVADKQAELNDANRKLAQAQQDREVAEKTRDDAVRGQEQLQKQKDDGDVRVREYEEALKKRHDAGGCGFSDDDLNRLQQRQGR